MLAVKLQSCSLFLSLTLLTSVKCEFDSGQDPLRQESDRPEPSRGPRVHPRRRKRPVWVFELGAGTGGLPRPLWLVQTNLLKHLMWGFVAFVSPSKLFRFCSASRWASNTFSIRGGKPLWVDPFDQHIQHIFIDDNIRQNDEDTIVQPKVLSTLSKWRQYERHKWLNTFTCIYWKWV